MARTYGWLVIATADGRETTVKSEWTTDQAAMVQAAWREIAADTFLNYPAFTDEYNHAIAFNPAHVVSVRSC